MEKLSDNFVIEIDSKKIIGINNLNLSKNGCRNVKKFKKIGQLHTKQFNYN
jgi:hypothetical protein